MSEYVRGPVLAMVGSLLAIILVGLAIVLLAGSGPPITAANSSALGSTGQGFNDMLPYVAIIIVSGVILTSMSRKR